MSIGDLNQRAFLFVLTLIPDNGGGYIESWEQVATIWAKVDPVSARASSDTLIADHLQSRPAYRITVRRSKFFTAGERLKISARTFLLRAIEDRGQPDPYITLYTEEIQ